MNSSLYIGLGLFTLVMLTFYVEYCAHAGHAYWDQERPVLYLLVMVFAIAWPLVIFYGITSSIGVVARWIMTLFRTGGDQ